MSAAKNVELDGVSKDFGPVRAIRTVSLHVRAGEFLTLLGPSGCGKSTMLRLIAGLEPVSSGTIRVGGEDVTDHPPNRRDTSIMFQDYALFPHKTLLQNVGYGLKMRGINRPIRDSRSRSWLQTIGLADYEHRYPHQLSGGQRQRVALARSLIVEPGVLLLDEPLGALDANLRHQMQRELRRMHRDVGLTFIYVTHDQEEALAMSDRVAVMRDGHIEQLGGPVDIYDRPETEFVARFIGACNVIVARVRRSTNSEVECHADGLATLVAPPPQGRNDYAEGERIALALRPEAVSVRLDREARVPERNGTALRVRDVAFTGATLKIQGVSPDGFPLDIELERRSLGDRVPPEPGDPVVVGWRMSDLTPLRRSAEDVGPGHDDG
ncbi:MAG: ABC transporter ATP-binding protein [Paracoccaceae bacterium]|nr:ABC transporter ATP-binding protein [Paracoccaceae bacterium]MDE2915073.1 ABC transporter ATP-binding protein [Paracoccaceae bacterium]